MLLAIDGLQIEAASGPIVEDLDLSVGKGEMVGLVGESGCGKTVTALAILGLLPRRLLRIQGGTIRFQGEPLPIDDDKAMASLRGNRIAMVFQEPMTALNPVFRVGDQIAEVLALHRGLSRRMAAPRVDELLLEVGLPAPTYRRRYPFQLSGGQRQRVMIAMALACSPDLLIADEPTTALDATVQAQILDLMQRMRRAYGMGCILITHDLGIVAEHCERAMVMYAGSIVERGTIADLFGAPMHPYLQALLETIPAAHAPGRALPAIPGMVPLPGARIAGCAFADRCPRALAQCRDQRPPLVARGEHTAWCWRASS